MLYRFLKLIVGLSIRIYYREIRVINQELLDQEGPVIIIANHPNTLMDAWILGYINRRRVHYMAKATFFSSPFKRKVLGAMGMIPINRKSDGATRGVKNSDSFEACYRLLEDGYVLVVFPEGTSYLERKLREIKTGTARIALEVEARNLGNLGVQVIPVGLNYMSADRFRGRVMVHVGKAISVTPFLEEYKTRQGVAAKKLTEKFRTELSRVFVTMEDENKEKLVSELTYLFDSRYSKEEERGVQQSIGLLKEIQQRLEELSILAPWKLTEIQQQTTALIESLQFFGIRPDFLDRPYRTTLYLRQTIQSWLFLILTIPVFLVGFIHNALPYYGIGILVPRLTKEVEYHAPLVVLLGMAFYPLTYLGWCFLFDWLFDTSWLVLLLYAGLLPFTGLFAHFFLRYMRHLATKQHFSRFAKRRRAVFQQLKQQREGLNDLIFKD
ncbi:MAG TPA: lysophospholipid acyltransferase family protein [Fluviicola sp.]|nr:lysophospholipid acyltransferase family protein [Fluviicola sp.]